MSLDAVFVGVKNFGTIISIIVLPICTLLYFKYVKSPMNVLTAAIDPLKKIPDEIDKINSKRLEDAVRNEETRRSQDKLEKRLNRLESGLADANLNIRENQVLLKREKS